jgi:hypothetical protein
LRLLAAQIERLVGIAQHRDHVVHLIVVNVLHTVGLDVGCIGNTITLGVTPGRRNATEPRNSGSWGLAVLSGLYVLAEDAQPTRRSNSTPHDLRSDETMSGSSIADGLFEGLPGRAGAPSPPNTNHRRQQ